MIELDDALCDRLARAIDDRVPVTAAYVQEGGRPHVAFYGSTHAFSGDQLALWVRNPAGALPSTLAARPAMAFSYGNIADRFYCTLEGRGRVVTDPAVRDRVYDGMHAIERMFDPDRKGVAVLIDLDHVTVLSAADGKREMHREPA